MSDKEVLPRTSSSSVGMVLLCFMNEWCRETWIFSLVELFRIRHSLAADGGANLQRGTSTEGIAVAG